MTLTREKRILAWHFLKDNGTAHGCDIKPPPQFDCVGKIYSVEGNIVPCEHGLHASVDIMDALSYAQGSLLCRVEIWGDVVEHGDPVDKICGRYRKILWKKDVTKILHEFACRCAEDALKLVDNSDPRSVAAITAKRNWLKGQITDEELAAARDAARAAAGAAARDAARDAARAKQRKRLLRMIGRVSE